MIATAAAVVMQKDGRGCPEELFARIYGLLIITGDLVPEITQCERPCTITTWVSHFTLRVVTF
jgi:hypothetical protein